MSRVIKQSFVALSDQKKVIQNEIQFHTLEAVAKKENATNRVVADIAESILQNELAQPIRPEPKIDLKQYEEEAEQIIAEANAQKAQIYEDAYQEGMRAAEAELHRKMANLEDEYRLKSAKLEGELRQKYELQNAEENKELEAKMILWMSGMLEKLVGQAGQKEQVITHLIRMGMQEIALQGDLIIRVSEQDLDYVLENKNKITEELSEKLTIEVLKDKNLTKNQCIIETVMGNIECSLDVQLKGIQDELKLIYESIIKNIHRQ